MSSSGINFTGIASGIDTNALTDQLIAVEAAPPTLQKQQKTVVDSRTSVLRDINTRLLTLKTASDSLRSFSLYSGTPYASSSDASISPTATSSSAAGSYNVVVSKLATGAILQQHADTYTA